MNLYICECVEQFKNSIVLPGLFIPDISTCIFMYFWVILGVCSIAHICPNLLAPTETLT